MVNSEELEAGYNVAADKHYFKVHQIQLAVVSCNILFYTLAERPYSKINYHGLYWKALQNNISIPFLCHGIFVSESSFPYEQVASPVFYCKAVC